MGNNTKEVDLLLLSSMIAQLFASIQRELGVTSLRLDDDFYWDLEPDDKYSIDKKPGEFLVGQLYDDWEFLSNAANRNEKLSPAMLCHVTPLLDYLSYSLNKRLSDKSSS